MNHEGPIDHTTYVKHALRVNGRCVCVRCVDYRIDVQRGRDPRAMARAPAQRDQVDPADLERQLGALSVMRAAMRRVLG